VQLQRRTHEQSDGRHTQHNAHPIGFLTDDSLRDSAFPDCACAVDASVADCAVLDAWAR
jgi:hypothetical protein